jgi:CheY-like chemotaxis protein
MLRALLDRGMFCDCVSTAGDAIARLAEQPYALIVLDFSLPQAGAVAVIESLRSMAAAERPMVIATATIQGAPDSDLVQMVFRRPPRVRDVADVVHACLVQVRTTWEAARNAATARSIERSGTST